MLAVTAREVDESWLAAWLREKLSFPSGRSDERPCVVAKGLPMDRRETHRNGSPPPVGRSGVVRLVNVDGNELRITGRTDLIIGRQVRAGTRAIRGRDGPNGLRPCYVCLTISTEISMAGVVPLFSSQCKVCLSSGQPSPGP